MCQKKFTKSAFKIALECPRRLYYAYDSKLYANQDLTDEFLKSLADGGFQVGELSKVYYGIKGDADIDVLGYDEAVEKTKSKYSKPVYGTPEMPSLNLENKVWIEYEEDGKTVKNPYKLLTSVSTYLDIPQEELDKMEREDDDTVSNGGAALAAYGKLQFSDTQMSQALEKALLCYCELDTLAMVFIWEYFNDCCKKEQ